MDMKIFLRHSDMKNKLHNNTESHTPVYIYMVTNLFTYIWHVCVYACLEKSL